MSMNFEEKVRCNYCEKEFHANEIIYQEEEDKEFCPYCGKSDPLEEPKMPQIDKLLTISSAHITLDTSGKLDVEPAFSPIDLSIYPKADFGWWLSIDPKIVKDDGTRRIPADLMECIKYAWQHDCTWLCLDCDGEIIPELPVYDWD